MSGSSRSRLDLVQRILSRSQILLDGWVFSYGSPDDILLSIVPVRGSGFIYSKPSCGRRDETIALYSVRGFD